MSKLDALLEAERRGILDAANAELLSEARRRGLVPGGQQQAALQPVPKPTQQPAAPDVNTLADVGKATGAGLVRGGLSLAGLPGGVETLGRMGINFAGRQLGAEGNVVSPETALPTYGDLKGRVEGAVGPLYEPKTRVGKFANTIAEFAPGALFPGGIAQRVIGNVVAPAVVSEAAGQATEGTSFEPYARVGGAIAGGFLPGMAARAIAPTTQSPARAAQAAVLDAEGVNMTAGQRTGSRPLRWSESAVGDMPFTGGRPAQIMEQQGEEFTRAVLRRVGENADRATPEVVNRAFNRIGNQFNRLAANYDLPPSQQLLQDIGRVVQDYVDVAPNALRAPIVGNVANDILQAFQTGQPLTGRQYQSMRSQLDRAARGAGQNVELTNALFGLRNALDDAMEQVLPAAEAQAWREARTQYRNLLVVEKSATRAGEAAAEGIISPSALRGAVVNQNQRNYARGQGDYAELARAGEAILKPLPQSGTAPRLAAQGLLSVLGAGAGGAGGGAEGAMAGAVAPMVLQALAGRALMSRPAQAYLGGTARYLPQQTAQRARNAVSGTRAARAQSLTLLDDYGIGTE